jgi:branched-chain amino acid transport system substrate-binding protein
MLRLINFGEKAMSRLSRRSILLGSAAGAAALSVGSYRRAALAQGGTIRVPIMLTLSGPLAPIGTPAKIGAEITAMLINKAGGVNGRNVEPLFVDDKGRPNDAVAATRELIGEGHKVLTGSFLSANLLAQVPILTESKVPIIGLGGTAIALSHDQFSRYLFPGLENDYQRSRMFARFASERLPNVTKWGALISESKPYIDSYGTFGKFAKEDYAAKGKTAQFSQAYLFKFGTTDFRPQLSQLVAGDTEALYNMVLGADGLTLWQQAVAFNLQGKIKAVIDQTLDFNQQKALKKRLPPNLWTIPIAYYAPYQSDPHSKAFYEEYVARTGDRFPSGYLQYGNQVMNIYAQTLNATKGSTDSEAVINALESVTFTTARGPYKYRKEDHVLFKDMTMVQVVGNDSEVGIEVKEWVNYKSQDFALPPNPGKPTPTFQ